MKLHCRSLLVVAIVSLALHAALAQTQAPMPQFASWGGGPFDMINLGNLGVRFTIPILHKAGRGTPFSYDITYDGNQVWSVVSTNGYTKWEPSSAFGWFNTSNAGTGGYISYDTVTSGGSCPINPPYTFGSYTQIEYYDFVYHDNAGFNHSIPDDVYYITQNSGCSAPQSGPQPPQVEPALANDGSGYTLYATPGPNSVSGYIVSKSGTTITPTFTSGAPVGGSWSAKDLNGNMITESAGAWTDTLDAQVLAIAGGPPNTTTLTYVTPSGGNAAYTIGYTNYTVQTWFKVSNGDPILDYGPASNYLISYIALPDDTPSSPDRYTFTYESTPSGANCSPLQGTSSCVTARLASVTLPTGGVITYSYSGGPSGSGIEIDGTTAGLSRTLSPGGTWTYSRTVGAQVTTTATDPAGNQMLLNFVESDPNDNFYEEQRLSYQGSISGTSCSQSVTTNCLLQTVVTCYNGASESTCSNNTTISEPVTQTTVYTFLPDASGLESETNTQYDGNGRGIIDEVDTYDYAQKAVGPLLRSVKTTYGSYNGGNCSTLSNNIFDHPCAVVVKDGSGNVVSETTYTYDESTPITTSEPQHLAVTGSRGNLTTVNTYTSSSAYLTQHFSYYDTGNVYQATDTNTAVTTYAYGACNNSFLTEVSLPLSLSTSEAWDCNGGVATSSTDMNGNPTTYTYDSMWRLSQTNFPDGGETQTTYNLSSSPPNIVTSQKKDNTPTWHTVTAILDGFGRTTEQQDNSNPLGTIKVDTTYDGLGRVATVSNPYVSTSDSTYGITQYSYDALSRPTTITNPDGSTKLLSYAGRATEIQDEGNGSIRVTKIYQSDGLGRLTSVCEVTSATQLGSSGTPSACQQDIAATGFLTSYGYDALGNLTSVIQPGVNTRTYTYDDLSRLTNETNPESGTTTYTYDSCSAGDLCTRVRPKANQTSPSVTTTTAYSYDALHRLASISYDDGTPTTYYYYDQTAPWGWNLSNPKGELTTTGTYARGWLTEELFNYDAMGRRILDEQCAGLNCPREIVAGYSYDLLGNLQTADSGGGWTYTYSRNAAEQITGIASSLQDPAHPGSLLSNVQYNPLGEETSAIMGNGSNGNGISESLSYDDRGRVTAHSSGVLGGPGNWGISGVSYAPDDDPLGFWDSALGGTWAYSYDDFDRLKTSSSDSNYYGNIGFSYAYDPFGNRWQQNVTAGSGPGPQYSFNSSNQISGSGVEYDAAGNTTNDGLGHTYTYDAEGRVLTVDSGNTATYLYDQFGRRASRTVSGSTVYFAYDLAGRDVFEYTPTENDRLEVFQPDNGRHLVTYEDSETFFDFQDLVGTEQLKITQDGSAYESNASLPFGDDVLAWGSGLGDTGPTRFSGQEWDSETNLTHFWFRQLSTIQGRWTTPDPAGIAAADPTNPQSWNRYAYVTNNPLSYTDSLGLENDCGGPCVPFMNDLGGGCYQEITYTTVIGADGANYDWPVFGAPECGGGFPQPPVTFPVWSGSFVNGGGGGGGWFGSFTLGIRAPGQSYSQCLAANSGNYSVYNWLPSSWQNSGAKFALGNDVSGALFGNANEGTAGLLVGAQAAAAPIGAGTAGTFGRRTATIFDLNLAGKGGPAPTILGETGAKELIGWVSGAFELKLAADVGATAAEALNCIVHR